MDIRPIRTDTDHAAALRQIEQYWGAAEGSDDGDRLDILVTLVAAYEDRRWPLAEVDPVEAIEAAMAQEGRTSRATEILQRKRALTLPMIRTIANAWHVPERALVREYPLVEAKEESEPKTPNPRTKAAMAESRRILRARRSAARSAA